MTGTMRPNGLIYKIAGNVILLIGLWHQMLNAQEIVITGSTGKVFPAFENRIDALVMLKGNTPATELKVETSLAVEWYSYYNAGFQSTPVFLSNQKSIQPDDRCGYLVKLSGTVDGKDYSATMSVFVIDYLKYQWSGDIALNPLAGSEPECEKLQFELTGDLKPMVYATATGLVYPVRRKLNLKYETLEWNEQWVSRNVELPVEPVDGKFQLDDPPLKDTYFELVGDQFCTELGIAPVSLKSALYPARKVACKITTEATVRTEKHEADRPESITTLSGSAPLEIKFISNGNEPVSNYYNWTIMSGESVLLSRTDATHTYTFKEAGTYLIRLRAENAHCSATDSVTVKISESAISAPNVFTPNGDGINDEFRVAYKSIIEFQGIIFNRWGTKIFEWTDIQKGWNGTHNGKPVSEGAYFYVIRAKGSDAIIHNLKGDINLLRGKK